MSKRHPSKHKIDRRLGVNLWGRVKSPLNRRDTAPGMHGARRKKPTDFGIQLMAKQKLKGYYGNISEKQFLRYYKEADRRKGDTSENLIGLLEHRLDAVIYRMKFVPTFFAARQFISHKHVKVNGRTVTVSSYLVKHNDLIEIKQGSNGVPMVIEASQSKERDIPDYLDVDVEKFRGVFLRTPQLSDVPYPVSMEPNFVVEYYSR